MSPESGMRERVLIKGAGEQASAAAHRLFRCGYRVLMTDLERPTAIRRTVSFCSAVYEREIEIEGVEGVLHRLDDLGASPVRWWRHIPVCVDPRARLVALWRPDVIVDARILKTNLDNQCSDAGLVIGLGPGLEAGRDVHYVVETMRGHDLGRIIERGFSRATRASRARSAATPTSVSSAPRRAASSRAGGRSATWSPPATSSGAWRGRS